MNYCRSLTAHFRFACGLLAAALVAFGSTDVLAKKGNEPGSKSARVEDIQAQAKDHDGGKAVKKERKPGNKDGRKRGGDNAKMRRRKTPPGTTGGDNFAIPNIRQDVFTWLLANNPGLNPHFLTNDACDREIKLPDGRTVPIYKLDQFLEVNFKLSYSSPDKEGQEVARMMSEHLRKILATPEFRDTIKHYKPSYDLTGRGKVSSGEAYDFFRKKDKHIVVKAGPEYHGTVGGGGGIAAPSYRMWKAMNLFWHESCHCLNIGHNSGGLSNVIAGRMKDMDKKKVWKYATIDLNSLKVPTK
jgi:hypothetical protein